MDPTLQSILNQDLAAYSMRSRDAALSDQRMLSGFLQNQLFNQSVMDANTAAITPSTLPRPAPFTAAEGTAS